MKTSIRLKKVTAAIALTSLSIRHDTMLSQADVTGSTLLWMLKEQSTQSSPSDDSLQTRKLQGMGF